MAGGGQDTNTQTVSAPKRRPEARQSPVCILGCAHGAANFSPVRVHVCAGVYACTDGRVCACVLAHVSEHTCATLSCVHGLYVRVYVRACVRARVFMHVCILLCMLYLRAMCTCGYAHMRDQALMCMSAHRYARR